MSGVLVIVELGAEWPSWLGTAVETVPGRGDRRVLSQTEGEAPEAFADRVAERLQPQSLFAKRVSLERVVIACNERSDERAMTARSKLSQALLGALGALSTDRSWQLLFTASGRTGRVRSALSTLATTLSSPLSGSKAAGGGARGPQHHTSIGVRFGDEMPLVQQANVA